MTPHRRYHTFNDHLRARFADKLQRVTLTGGMVCPYPEGKAACPFCAEASRVDPAYGRGYPAHEQIRRGSNFTRRHGEAEHRLIVTIPVAPLPFPLDHLRATLDTAAIDAVAAIMVSARPGELTEEMTRLLAEYVTPDREVWLDLENVPEERPRGMDERLKIGVLVDLERAGEREDSSHGFLSLETAAERILRLKPDAIGFVAPAIVDGSPEARRFQDGEIEEEDLETFAERAARFLEMIPADVAVQPIVVSQKADSILAPAWVLNRQKVQEAVGRALEDRGTTQGAGCSSARAEGQQDRP